MERKRRGGIMTTNSELYCGIDLDISSENDLIISPQQDFKTKKYYNNLEQAIINRLRTQQGELLQHPNYGSQLKKLIGQKNNDLILSEIRQFVREALLQEPRINEIKSIQPNFRENSNDTIEIHISVTPIGNVKDVLNLVWDFFIV
jgi:phage baseplate assembly protein W